MRYLVGIPAIMLLLISACASDDKPSYTPPTYTATVYALAASDHVAVLDLKSNKLERIKLGREGVDLAGNGNRVFVLSANGAIAEIKGKTVGKWTKITDRGKSAAFMGQDRIIILGMTDICVYNPDTGAQKRVALKKTATSITFDPRKNLIWCIDREHGRGYSIKADDFKMAKELPAIGNAPHHALAFPGTNDIWVAEGNEFMDGKPYGVGFAEDGPAMSGGINVVDTISGRQTDFIMVGGNVVDLVLSADKKKMYVATSQYPEYLEATMSVVNPEQRRVKAEFRLCLYCHDEHNVELENGRALVRALAIVDPDVKITNGKK